MSSFVELVKAIAWPVVVIWLAYLFKEQFVGMLSRVSKLKGKFKDLEFETALDQAEASVAVIEKEISVRPAIDARTESQIEQLKRIAEISPRAAIVEAWRVIEGAAAKSGFVQGGQVPLKNAPLYVDWLVQTGKLPPESSHLITELKLLRNQAAHTQRADLPEFQLTQRDAERYLELAAKVSSLILRFDE